MKNSWTCMLACITGAGLMTGCLPEDEPNGDPETAWQTGDRSFQNWYGNPSFPAEGTLPFPSGHGTLPGVGGLTAGDVDCWPISLFDYVTGERGDVSSFNATLWVSPGDTVVVGWSKWLSGDGAEAVWVNEQLSQLFVAPEDRFGIYTFSLGISDGSTYSFNVSGSDANYGFILAPVLN